jgi:hypothetical protein
MFTSQSRARSMQLHHQLSTLKKGDSSMADFYHKFTSLADTLAAIDQPLKDFDLVSFFLAELGSDYDAPITTNKTDLSCSACLSSKSKQLPFSLSRTQFKFPLELIYSDVWGNSPVCSRNGNRYYISFLDAYSRYTWLFPMSHKNDALPIFIKFQKYVERYFNLKIKSLQSNWGGEYRSLSNYITNCGITHRVSCPHTHQQNGAVERKHRHIVETGLALLSHASIPLRFWDDAFQTACYLINRLPQKYFTL